MGLLFVVSISLVLISFLMFKTFGLIELGVISSWFFVYFRPLTIDYCRDVVIRDLYYWNSDFYIFGVIFSGFSLIVFQIGALHSLPRNHMVLRKFRNYSSSKVLPIFQNVLFFNLALYCSLLFVLFVIYGANLFPWHRLGTGATSAGLPGFEFAWPMIRILLFFIISLSLFLFFETQKLKYILFFVITILTILILGRRGILVSPIIFFLFIYVYYSHAIKKDSLRKFLNFKYLFVGLVLAFIVFLGKSVAYNILSGEVLVKSDHNSSIICSAITSGHQEFDLLWPAVIDNYVNNFSVSDFGLALVGNFISHEERLLNHPGLYSITDKLMMSHMGDSYLYRKFGISPNMYQFYFSYLGGFSIIFLLFLGFLLRKIEINILYKFLLGNVFFGYLLLLFFNLFKSPIDYVLKYFIVEFIYSSILIYMYRFYLKINKSFRRISWRIQK